MNFEDEFAKGATASTLYHVAKFWYGEGRQQALDEAAEVAINNQGTVSQFPTVAECVAFNKGCRDVAEAILKLKETP